MDTMRGFACNRVRCFYALLAVLAGCNGNPTVTVSASYLKTSGDEAVEAGSVASMMSHRTGAIVTIGGTSDEGISAKIAQIANNQIVLDVTHSEFDPQQVNIKLGETKDVFFGDGSRGVRLRFIETR